MSRPLPVSNKKQAVWAPVPLQAHWITEKFFSHRKSKLYYSSQTKSPYLLRYSGTCPFHIAFYFQNKKVLICLTFPVLIPSFQSPKAEYNLYLHTPAYVCSPARLTDVSAKMVSANRPICPQAPTQSYRPVLICVAVASPLCWRLKFNVTIKLYESLAVYLCKL